MTTRAEERRLWFHTPIAEPYELPEDYISRKQRRVVILSLLRASRKELGRAVGYARRQMQGGTFDPNGYTRIEAVLGQKRADLA